LHEQKGARRPRSIGAHLKLGKTTVSRKRRKAQQQGSS
jgi:hypothetical protein